MGISDANLPLVHAAIDAGKIRQAADAVFFTISKDIGFVDKLDLMRHLVRRFGDTAIDYITGESFNAGGEVADVGSLEQKDPALFSRFKALSFGLMLFKDKGFAASLNLIKASSSLNAQRDSTEHPSVCFIGGTALSAIMINHLMAEDDALARIYGAANDPALPLFEKSVLVKIAIAIRPEEVCKYRSGPAGEMMMIAQTHLEGDLKGKVSCG